MCFTSKQRELSIIFLFFVNHRTHSPEAIEYHFQGYSVVFIWTLLQSDTACLKCSEGIVDLRYKFKLSISNTKVMTYYSDFPHMKLIFLE